MEIPIVLVLITLAAVAFNMYLRSSKPEKQYDNAAKLLEADRRSNYSGIKLIPDTLYLTVDLERLPMREYPDEIEYLRVSSKQFDAARLARNKMICLNESDGNTYLKNRYGIANWELILMYEDNYNSFIHGLLEWASALIAMDNDYDAEAVLRLAIEYHCDRSQCFLMLADILARRSNLDALAQLKEFVADPQTMKENLSVKDKVIAYIEAREQGDELETIETNTEQPPELAAEDFEQELKERTT